MWFFFLSAVLFSFFLLSPGSAGAQEFDLFEDKACKEDPNGEECICAKVVQLRLQPLRYTRAGRDHNPGHPGFVSYTGEIRALDVDGSTVDVDGVPGVPVRDPDTGLWSGKQVTDPLSIVRMSVGLSRVRTATSFSFPTITTTSSALSPTSGRT